MTAPVPNSGMNGEGLALVASAKDMLEKAISLPGLGAETEIGQAIVDSLKKIGVVLPEGSVTPGQKTAAMQKFMMSARRDNAPMLAALMASMHGGGGAPGMGAAPPATPGQPIPAM